MSAVLVRHRLCDLCGYEGRPDLFTLVQERFDFCRWCMSGPVLRSECGGHIVDVTDGTWSCSCGKTHERIVETLRAHGVTPAALGAVPHLTSATAALHVQTPRWPLTW